MHCLRCGSPILAGAASCPMCHAVVGQKGFWSRLLGAFKLPKIKLHTHVSRSPDEPQLSNRQADQLLNDLPSDLREQVETQLKVNLPQGIPTNTTRFVELKTNYLQKQTYKFRDQSGKEQVFHSLEEMPPEIRKIFENGMS